MPVSTRAETPIQNCAPGCMYDAPVHCSAGEIARREKRTVRILFVIDQLSALGGGERAMMQLIRGLSRRFQCSVVTFRRNVHPEVSALVDAPITVIPLRRSYSPGGLRAALELARMIRRQRVEIVHTFFETSDLFGGLVARFAGVKGLISSRRDMGLLRSAKHRFAYRLLGRMYNRVITVSEAVRSQVLASDRLAPDRITTVYTGVCPPARVSEDALLELRKRMDIPPGAPVILTVANILPWKGHREFLEAASIVHTRFPAAHFVVAGAYHDLELVNILESRRDELGLSHCVHYAGEVRPVGPMYQLASVFCLLSQTEGLPNVVLEAMAAGTPVIVTPVGGSAELVVHRKTGLLVNPGSPPDAAKRICEVLSSPHSARQMAEAARGQVTVRFSMEQMIHSLEAIYDAILAE
jgi:glycosyltransferase involved in cell wall biosynthesis